ncbi:VWA domain-containing protein [Mycolicibacterium sp. 018/SC-01/001]|uniref:vWA domain-containing protein n=1 Tax=Mycolicibacterium sp. 018/SC-01/001 TaxID=2592069 RepID=UPI00117C729B|nr:vWA domain-containing protein [Mycolicibacterium sp. 018/SC-01/001]TRW86211.1 VWA domain-containing protein [Mycolicibacterium sp. 018/SC-01/001]
MKTTSAARVVMWALLGAVVASTLQFAAPVTALTGDTAVSRFGGCLAAQRSGQLLLMIDESSSLQDTDPGANRVKASRYLARQLADYTDRTGVALDVAVAGFSSDYQQALGWTRLDNSSLPQVESTLDSFRDKNTGDATDYWTALDGARSELADAPKPAEGQRCQALAWFTDGKLDFSQKDRTPPFAPDISLSSQAGVDAAVKAAQDSICRDKGQADQLRSSGVVTFAIGLSSEPDQVADFDLLKSIATGSPSGSVTSCGAVTEPIPGDFYLAQNIEDLLFAFDKVGTPDQVPIEVNTGSCARTICEEGKHRFVLDRSVRSVSVLAAADRPGLMPYLVAPDGTSLDLSGPEKNASVGGVTVDSKPQSDKSISFRMVSSESPLWQGIWALVFVDPTGDGTARTRSSIHIAGDLYPSWPAAAKTTLRNKDKVALTFAVVDGKQKFVDPATLLGQATFSAALIDGAGLEHPIATALTKDQIAQPQELDLTDIAPGAATLQLSLDITTADAMDPNGAVVAGTKLTPQRLDLPVNISPPAGYPTVTGPIDFGKLEGAGTLASSLTVTGPGCVWVATDAKNTVKGEPDGIGSVTVSSSANSRDNCIKLGDGEQKTLPVTLTVAHPGTGAATGTIDVSLGPDTADEAPLTVAVDYTASLRKPLDTGNFALALIVALILGPGLPVGLLYLSKWCVSRIPARGLRSEQIPVRINGGSVLRDSGPFTVADNELNALVPGLDKPARRLDLGSGVQLRAKMGIAPFGSGYVVAKAPGRAGAAGRAGATIGKTPDAKLPLAVHNTWFVLHDPTGPAEFATVVLLAGVDADYQLVQRLVDEVIGSVPKIVSDLRARAASDHDEPPGSNQQADPFGTEPGGVPNPFAGGARDNPFGVAAPSGRDTADRPNSNRGNPVGSNPFGGPEPTAPTPYRPMGPEHPGGDPFGAPGRSAPPPPPSTPGGNPFA